LSISKTNPNPDLEILKFSFSNKEMDLLSEQFFSLSVLGSKTIIFNFPQTIAPPLLANEGNLPQTFPYMTWNFSS